MSPRRLWITTRLDLRHNVRRPLFWIWILVLGWMAAQFADGSARIQSGDSDVGGTKALITSEFAIAQMLSAFVLLLYAFFIAVAAGMALIRDDELRVGAILHTTPLSAGEYVWGKFLAAAVSFLAVLAAHLALVMFFYHVTGDAAQKEFVGAFDLQNYLRPALLLALPMIVFLAGVTFWVGARFRRPILVFFLPVALLLLSAFFTWEWSPVWLPPWANNLLMWLDPTGFRWLNETFLDVDRGVEFYNTARIPFDVPFLVSRVGFFLLGLLAPALAARRFARTLRGQHERQSGAAPGQATSPARRAVTPSPLADLAMHTRRPGILAGILTVTRVEFRELRHSPGLYLFIPLIVLITVINAAFTEGPFGTEMLWTAGTLAVGSAGMLSTFVCCLLMFFTVESLRREDGTGLAPIHHATPLRTTSLLFGKSLANALVGVATILATLVTALVLLLVQGKTPIDLVPFGIVWGVILLPTFLLWCSFVSFVYAIARNRYTTYAVALAALMYTGYEAQTGGLDWVSNWPLWQVLQWSDMSRFELVRDELLLNRVLALLAALWFTALTVMFFPRRHTDPTNRLLRLRPRALARSGLKLLPVTLPVVAVGVVLGLRIDVGYQGDAAEKAGKDYWRKNVATYFDARYPDLAGVDVRLDLYPERRAFETRGTFRIENRSQETYHAIPLTIGFGWRGPDSIPDAAAPLWTLDGAPHVPEDSAGLLIFRLATPMTPGKSIEIGFHHSGNVPYGATKNGGGAPEFILPGGVVLTSFRPTFVPTIGYDPNRGVDDENSSDAKDYPPGHYEGETRSLFGGGFGAYHVRLEVTAPERFRINCIGVLEKESVADGRRTATWQTDHPVRFFNVVCGEWAVQKGDLETAIYYHPAHKHNVAMMAEALAGARRYYSEWFHPYPWKELKLSQFPGLAGYAQGFATNITFSEAIGFLTKDDEARAEAPFMVTAHEAAHQWWGNLLVPGEGPGGNILSEGMAHFSTLLLLEQMRGLEARIDFATDIEASYGRGRQQDSERPMVRIDGSRPGDTTATYDKGGFVFWMLLNFMGREPCLAGLQSFIRHYQDNRDHPLLEDFLAHLRPFAEDPAAYDAFTRQWFLEVVLPQYRIQNAKKSGSGPWTTTFEITNTGTGRMPVDVAVAAGERFGEETTYQEARTTVTLGPGARTELRIGSSFEPSRILVDPDAKVLMLKRKLAKYEW